MVLYATGDIKKGIRPCNIGVSYLSGFFEVSLEASSPNFRLGFLIESFRALLPGNLDEAIHAAIAITISRHCNAFLVTPTQEVE